MYTERNKFTEAASAIAVSYRRLCKGRPPLCVNTNRYPHERAPLKRTTPHSIPALAVARWALGSADEPIRPWRSSSCRAIVAWRPSARPNDHPLADGNMILLIYVCTS